MSNARERTATLDPREVVAGFESLRATVRFELSHAAYVGYAGFPYLSVRQ